MEHDQLIGRLASARPQVAASEISIAANRGAAKSVPSVRHRRKRNPGARLWVVALVFGKGVVGRQFTAQYQNQSVVRGAADAAARSRHRRRRTPRVGLGIVY